MVEIVYNKKTTGETVKRTVRPYEIDGNVLWGTDTIHGAGQIHKFYVDRIQSIQPTDRKFKPRWEIDL